MDLIKILQEEFQIKRFQVENTVKLIDEGNTIPFIARYRKEMTGTLDDQVLRALYERLCYLRTLAEKKEQIQRTVSEQGNLTEELSEKLAAAKTMTELEDLYRPFRPKRRTRATIAKEKGLSPLAELIWEQENGNIQELAKQFVDEKKGVLSVEEAIGGAKDILAEKIADDADIRRLLREETTKAGAFVSKAADEAAESVYEMYYHYQEPLKNLAGHRLLAVNRGEKEGFLTVKVEADTASLESKIALRVIKKTALAGRF